MFTISTCLALPFPPRQNPSIELFCVGHRTKPYAESAECPGIFNGSGDTWTIISNESYGIFFHTNPTNANLFKPDSMWCPALYLLKTRRRNVFIYENNFVKPKLPNKCCDFMPIGVRDTIPSFPVLSGHCGYSAVRSIKRTHEIRRDKFRSVRYRRGHK